MPESKTNEKIPADLKKALAAAPRIMAKWEDLTPVSRRDFVRWIESAKQEITRQRRVTVACSKLAAGQRRPCCYSVVPLNLYTALNSNPKAKATWSSLTADERRDVVDYLDGAIGKDEQRVRVKKICGKLATGKK